MAEPHVTVADLDTVPENLREPLTEQLDSALRRAVRVVDGDTRGEPVDDVADRLLDETKSALHPDIADGFSPDKEDLRRVAEEIVAREAAA
ncbi:hypothetical protein Val02_12370 [Virgisporangium aliadipatigenens]|uniref:Uncharacterized protein n=1 Tax=Virgisporangium aliadipatigenens TaxID=741659 RepID=A0A8J4DNZ7_9ACTN|nr:hypothetical protein [Virgisporangium aliadipatigenens]GIJ44351.1 hypothetical protein Val02_12370 [Virgisporangium aliadipatigenens]